VAQLRKQAEDEASQRRRRSDEAAPPTASLVGLQSAAGNRAVATMVARLRDSRLLPGTSHVLVQREYTPKRNEAKDFKRWVTLRWDRPEDDVADVTAEITKWCSSHSQADELTKTVKYVDFDHLRSTFKTADDAVAKHGSFENAAGAQPAPTAQAQPKGPATDPHAEAKRQIKNAGFKAADFSEEDLLVIEAGKSQSGVGWAKAIADVRTAKIEKETSAKLASDRATKYAPAKAQGDVLFTDPLARRVWAAAHALAISGSSASSNPNITLSGDAVRRTDALAAVADWRAHETVYAGLVDQVHVPGGGQPIQDKANRETNPDPERGFQVDFCSNWSNTKVNVHVDVLTSSMR